MPSESLKELLRVDSSRGVRVLLTQWAVIFAVVAISESFWHPLLYAAAVLIIGGRQVALMLVVHEAVHNVLARDRTWNDRLAEWFAAWPILLPYRSYRQIHRQHHLYLGTTKDPDFARNRPDRIAEVESFRGLLRLLLGLEGRQVAVSRFWGPGDPEVEGEGLRSRPLIRAALYAAVVLGAAWLGGLRLLALYWMVPLVWFVIGMRLKGIAEHFALPGDSHFTQSRTFQPSLLANVLITPLHAAYHIEHHLYPAVPHYRLPQLHDELSRIPEFASRAHVTAGYTGFFAECLTVYRSSRSKAADSAVGGPSVG